MMNTRKQFARVRVSTMQTAISPHDALELHRKLVALKESIGLHFLEVGRTLYELREGGGWQSIVGDGMSWEAYCMLPEVSISPSHARNLMRLYHTFIIERGIEAQKLAKIDQRKLLAIAPVVDEDNAEEMLAHARELSRPDLVKLLKESKVGNHAHEWESIAFRRCKLCYEREEI